MEKTITSKEERFLGKMNTDFEKLLSRISLSDAISTEMKKEIYSDMIETIQYEKRYIDGWGEE